MAAAAAAAGAAATKAAEAEAGRGGVGARAGVGGFFWGGLLSSTSSCLTGWVWWEEVCESLMVLKYTQTDSKMCLPWRSRRRAAPPSPRASWPPWPSVMGMDGWVRQRPSLCTLALERLICSALVLWCLVDMKQNIHISSETH